MAGIISGAAKLMTNPLKLLVCIDAQNTYRRARMTFFGNAGPGVNGQFSPMKLAKVIEARGGPGGVECILTDVRVYTGRPDPHYAPKTHAAHLRQCRQWETEGAVVITRPLRYPASWPAEPAEGKGIDVALSIDFVAMAVGGSYDIGVIVSTDNDMLPALEYVIQHYSGIRHVAVAAWRSESNTQRLLIPGSNLWCHHLYREDYEAVADYTNYNRRP